MLKERAERGSVTRSGTGIKFAVDLNLCAKLLARRGSWSRAGVSAPALRDK